MSTCMSKRGKSRALVMARDGDIKLESLRHFPFQPHLPFHCLSSSKKKCFFSNSKVTIKQQSKIRGEVTYTLAGRAKAICPLLVLSPVMSCNLHFTLVTHTAEDIRLCFIHDDKLCKGTKSI